MYISPPLSPNTKFTKRIHNWILDANYNSTYVFMYKTFHVMLIYSLHVYAIVAYSRCSSCPSAVLFTRTCYRAIPNKSTAQYSCKRTHEVETYLAECVSTTSLHTRANNLKRNCAHTYAHKFLHLWQLIATWAGNAWSPLSPCQHLPGMRTTRVIVWHTCMLWKAVYTWKCMNSVYLYSFRCGNGSLADNSFQIWICIHIFSTMTE